MSKINVFLVKADNDKEAVMRLPVDRYGGITGKGFELIRKRFYDNSTETVHGLKHAINLESYSNGKDISEAIRRYYANIL